MRHFPDLPLQSSSTLLQTYTGESMKVLGEMQVKVQHDRQERNLLWSMEKDPVFLAGEVDPRLEKDWGNCS